MGKAKGHPRQVVRDKDEAEAHFAHPGDMESLKAHYESFRNTNFRQMLLQVVNLGARRWDEDMAVELDERSD